MECPECGAPTRREMHVHDDPGLWSPVTQASWVSSDDPAPRTGACTQSHRGEGLPSGPGALEATPAPPPTIPQNPKTPSESAEGDPICSVSLSSEIVPITPWLFANRSLRPTETHLGEVLTHQRLHVTENLKVRATRKLCMSQHSVSTGRELAGPYLLRPDRGTPAAGT